MLPKGKLVVFKEPLDYLGCWQKMADFTSSRTENTADEFWLLQHPHVFTLGQSASHSDIINAGDIPVVKSDRGGQVAWHGPGQAIIYTLLDLRRIGLSVHQLVGSLEQTVVDVLAEEGITGVTYKGTPGVYVGQEKIAFIGLRIRKGCSFHGIAVNVDPDLSIFNRILACGIPDLKVTSLQRLIGSSGYLSAIDWSKRYVKSLSDKLGVVINL